MTTREVVLDGGSPWGFRMHGGADLNQPLRISRVNPGSKAAHRGIREGDLITSINGQSTRDISNADAHKLLKHAGDSLVLGLNEELSGSPKRRQYKTVHQETHSETVKRSSITTYSIKKEIVESSDSKPRSNNENSSSQNNEKQKQINGKQSSSIEKPKLTNSVSNESTSSLTGSARNNSSDIAIASQRSSYSNLTPSPSTASTLTEDGKSARGADVMADNSASSRSRRRRARNNRRKNKNKQCDAVIVEDDTIDDGVVETETKILISEQEETKIDYRVESPERAKQTTKAKDIVRQTSITKSKSLDNDEMLKIQELSDASESENKADNQGIISEASESEVEWEETDTINAPVVGSGTLSTMSLPLENYHLEEVNLISPEEELTLRNFLEGLNLVNSPEDSAQQVKEASTPESIKAKKAQKRAALEEYFLPKVHNPRFLDAISEEPSDQSDKEIPMARTNLKQGTPELENTKDLRPPVPIRRHRRSINRNQQQISNPAVLVGTKIIETVPTVTGVQSVTSILPETSKAEVVFLSSSESPETLSDNEEDANSKSTCSTGSNSLTESTEKLSEKTSDDNISVSESLTETHSNMPEQLMKDNVTTVSENKQENGYSQLQKNTESIIQFTPPPTPDNSPKTNQTNVKQNLLTFTESVQSNVTVNNLEILKEVMKDDRFVLLPEDLKTRVQNATQVNKDPKVGDEENKLNDEVAAISKPIQEGIKYSNVISPPAPSRSPSPSSESSMDTSLSTAKYNPMNSSIGDMSTFTKEDELSKDKTLLQPLSLREQCLKYLITMPFGEEILQELADVSQSIESYTSKLPSSLLPKLAPNLPAYVYNKNLTDNNSESSNFPVKPCNSQEMPSTHWVGMPTEKNPNVLVCLSPTQKAELERSKKVQDEAGKLLELHEKFMSRKLHDEVTETRDETVKVTTINKCNNNISINTPTHRLLAIIREEPSETASVDTYETKDDSNTLNFKEYNPRTFPSSATLPRNKHGDQSNGFLDDARLKAKDLTEWLQLARHKSMSESNITFASDRPHVSTNNRMQSENNFDPMRRRTSLPQELYERQMQYLLEKERDIQRELERVEEEKMKLASAASPSRQFHADDYVISRKGDYAVHNENRNKPRPTSMPAIPTEFFRQQMYEEYMNQIAEREERKQLKVIKVSSSKPNLHETDAKEPLGEVQHVRDIEEEFMEKVRQKKGPVKEDSAEPPVGEAPEEEDTPVLVIDGESLKDTKQLPKHLKEFIDITKQTSETVLETERGIWSPGQRQESVKENKPQKQETNETIPPVWTPKSANSSPVVERKEFKPINFQSPVLSRRNKPSTEQSVGTPDSGNSEPSWKSTEVGINLSSTLEKRLPTSHSLPSTGFSDFTSPRLPKAQNPTITLLQKAREGQLPRGAHYIEPDQSQQRKPQNERPPGVSPGEVLYTIKNEYVSDSETERPRKMATLGPRQFQGIGPTTRDGMPLILRSEVKDSDQSKWYKKMYDTIHKQKPQNAQYPYTSGYMSEPEPGAYDSDYTDYKYATLDRRRTPFKEREHEIPTSNTIPRNLPNKSLSSTDVIRNGTDMKPGRIENYTPGHSSIAEKEAKEWWDEVMDIFDGWLDDNSPLPSYDIMMARALAKSHLDQQKKVAPHPKSFINQALKESGYESDSTLVFKRKEDMSQQLSSQEQKEAYKIIQKGGDVPLHGLRKPAPEKPQEPEAPPPPPKGQYLVRSQSQESPRKYVEKEVTIHYKTPVRQEIKEYLSEDELAYKQAEAMKKIYQEERRRKYLQVSKSLQELQDMNSRRHTDNFIPSQKSPIALNRYDDFDEVAPGGGVKPRPRSPEPRLFARALYNFVGQTARELTFRKGEIIHVRRQIDKNWYEGELNAMVGLFPVNHVEIIPFDAPKTVAPTARKSYEGQARAKFNFVAQTHLELSLAKGELVTITRRVDDNWYEGKIGGRKGIFPVSYVEVLIDPHDPPPPSTKPVASPAAHSILLNGSSQGKESMGTHSYVPTLPNPQLTATTYQAKPVQITGSGTYGSLNRYMKNPVNQALHIETQSEPTPYRALYKYKPQNDDELELMEGDTVFVLEKCDDGWYVGSSERTGAFGTFPGNYVEKI
ncbi:uncharacterized protein LOC109593978 isoform X6 [Aethina tumida]|uniref:uncharacterized protein LOC109593978 isoform X6 n=1 Tax=Aethina tumida TaxID=116153 RepID=UPI002148072D|nr:uncharacterized protein LOC109593978 isoform X6 [Aethina tumida]